SGILMSKLPATPWVLRETALWAIGADWAQYLPPVFVVGSPPQTIISLSPQTAVLRNRAEGALVVLVAVQLSVPGLYLPPVFKSLPLYPPQTIISLPLQTAVDA